jgi:hypothetical protein
MGEVRKVGGVRDSLACATRLPGTLHLKNFMKLLEFCNFKDSSINNIRKMKNHHTFRCIGKGCCGSIWALNNDSDWVVKREDGGDRGRSITNDQIMHRKVIAAVTESKEVPVRIPKSY